MPFSRTFWLTWQSRSRRLLRFGPTHKLAWLIFGAGIACLLISVVSVTVLPTCTAIAALCIAALSFYDLTTIPDASAIHVSRQCDRLEERQPATIVIAVEISQTRPSWAPDKRPDVAIRDSVPAILDTIHETFLTKQTTGHTTRYTLTLDLLPLTRGDATFGDIYVRVAGRLGLWHHVHQIPAATTIAVWPDTRLTPVKRAALLRALAGEGHVLQRGGLGLTEFDHVRDFTPGDDPRHVNWFASARQHRLMKNVYRPERGQHVLLAIDCGRTMGALQTEDKTRLDLAIEAALLVAQAALHSGDEVSLIAFADRVLRHIPHQKGKSGLRVLTEGLYNLQPLPAYTGPHILTELVFTHYKRRSLLIYFSDLSDLVQQDLFERDIAVLERRHACVVSSTTDEALAFTARAVPTRLRAAATTAAAAALLLARSRFKERLAMRGVTVIESRSEVFSGALAQYVRFKNAGVATAAFSTIRLRH